MQRRTPEPDLPALMQALAPDAPRAERHLWLLALLHWIRSGMAPGDGADLGVVLRHEQPLQLVQSVTAEIKTETPALALVEDDYGTELAQTVARWLVLYLRRPGGQTQFAAPVWMPRARHQPIRDVQEAIEAEPGGGHSVAELAGRAAMSPRHFTRVFTEQIGEPPAAYVERIRIDAARRQLEESADTVSAIAARCGFGSAETMRRNFVRRMGISPDQYRRTFAHA